jgi:type II secretory pathway component PulM
VNRVDRGPFLLGLAGTLLLLAVVAYLISDAEANLERKESALRTQEALHMQTERAIAECRIHEAENDRIKKDRARLDSQQDAIIKSLRRIEAALETAAPSGAGR